VSTTTTTTTPPVGPAGQSARTGQESRWALKRRQLFEFEDLPWLPTALRDLITDVLRDEIVLGRDVYAPVAPVLADVIREQDAAQLIDLCSGAGGPWPRLRGQLAEEGVRVDLILTDRYPNHGAGRLTVEADGSSTYYETEPVDATAVPEQLRGIRTLFTSFHHFRPERARAILADAQARDEAICVFEFTERRRLPIALTLALAPLGVWAHLARRRPVHPLHVALALLPAPLAVTWDGIVSNLRTYLPEELRDLVADLHRDDYRWISGTLNPPKRGGAPVIYLIGQPVETWR
jgi:hypothetical protein